MTETELTINNLEFAQKEKTLKGDLALRDLPRLMDWFEELGALNEEVIPSLGEAKAIHYELSGSVSAANEPFLDLSMQFKSPLICQRCMQPVETDMDLKFRYLVSTYTEEEIVSAELDVEDDYDVVEQERAMDLKQLIVDEVIAAIPYAPMHESKCAELKAESGEKPNPFAILKSLKKN